MAVKHEFIDAHSTNDDDKTIRSGTLWTTIAHIITAVIGSGVLSLAWSTAQLGWIGGPVALFSFAFVTLVSSCLLSDCYRSPDPVTGTRNRCFTDAVRLILENGKIDGSITGVPISSVAHKSWLTFQALGDIAFAYPYALILLEIQDTVKSPPPENRVMKRASAIAILITTFFYLGCGCFGYAAFGNNTPGNLLTGFGFYEPYWLISFANVCIIIHLMGGYQLYSQPVFAFAERWLTGKFPTNRFLKNFYDLKLPMLPVFRVNLFRLCFRTVYVATTTGIALLFPYFNQILGVLGALNLWPLAIYFPVEMYIVQRNVESWSRKWVLLEIFSGVLMVVSVVALVGSVAGLIEAKMN